MKVYIIGYMGVGKSAIGKRLASALDLPFLDLDEMITKREERSILSIFDAIGELGFREKETEALRKISQKDFVLSTGGGTPCMFENMNFMVDSGIVVWLKMSPKMLTDRLKNGKENRPLIAHLADEDLPAFIEANLELRYPYYSQAQIHFDAGNFNSERLEELVSKLKSYSK